MRDLLYQLKNYSAVGIKLELESESLSWNDAVRFKTLADEARLDLIVKIGGCASVNDITFACKLGAKTIVTPMIESPYALEKFYLTAREIGDFKLDFNIETVQGLKNLDDILKSKYIANFNAVIFGRSDFCASCSDFDCEDTLDIAKKMKRKVHDAGLEFIVGGNVTAVSIDFLRNIGTKFETRKVIFDPVVIEKNFNKALERALEFEILWLNSKENRTPLDETRIKEILRRLNFKVKP